LLSCFLFSGCTDFVVFTKDIIGKSLDAFPTVVLSTQERGSHNYVFDWDKNTIGGVSLSKYKPKAKHWRLHLFNFGTGERIAPKKIDWKFLDSDTKETFEEVPFDKLLRADLDLTDDIDTGENAKTYSINFILHDQ